MNASYQDQTFGEILIAEGLITLHALERVLGERENAAEPIGDLLVRLGLLSKKDRARCLGKQIGVPFVDLGQRDLDPQVARLIPQPLAIRLLALPIERSDTAVSVAMVSPLDIGSIDELRANTGLEVDTLIASEEDIREAIGRTFGAYDDLSELVGEAMRGIDPVEPAATEEDDSQQSVVNMKQLMEVSGRSSIVRLVNTLFARAVSSRASDIHLGPEKGRVRVRFRVDGMLQEVMSMPKDLQYPLTSRLKIMANMDIAERRAPQDGRISLVMPQGEFDFRVSSYPSLHGENIVMRVLDKKAARGALDKIGMQPDMLSNLLELIRRPYGMFLVCGPTGSGKTTTLYACLNSLNSVDRNIMTIEDPVEYQLPGIVQGNVNTKAGVTFATGLRTLVRQDPDIILVGEIRDAETAQIAVEAALTGHLVLSTIHANDSAGAVTRLIDMGVEPFLIASALIGALAQRLVRLICGKCGVTYVPEAVLLEAIGCADLLLAPDYHFRRGAGCDICNRTGYKGRTGVYELMQVNGDIQRLILTQAPSQEIRQVALNGRRTLRDDAMLKLRQGITTPEEIVRVTII